MVSGVDGVGAFAVERCYTLFEELSRGGEAAVERPLDGDIALRRGHSRQLTLKL